MFARFHPSRNNFSYTGISKFLPRPGKVGVARQGVVVELGSPHMGTDMDSWQAETGIKSSKVIKEVAERVTNVLPKQKVHIRELRT